MISTPLEHSSVRETLAYLQEKGYEIDLLDLRRDGTVDLEQLADLLREDTVLVAVCAVDSELGTIQPLEEIKKLVKPRPNCHLHVDATQAIGRIPLSFDGMDTMCLAPHKFGGLNGSGLLLKRDKLVMEPLLHGGASTTIYRGGTPALGAGGIHGNSAAAGFGTYASARCCRAGKKLPAFAGARQVSEGAY